MNDEAARQGRPTNASGSYDCSDRRGRRAPALVIRLEVGQVPSVIADWDDDHGDLQFTRWIDENPKIARLAHLAVELSVEAA